MGSNPTLSASQNACFDVLRAELRRPETTDGNRLAMRKQCRFTSTGLLAATLLIAAAATAAAQNCAGIKDDRDRLACFDSMRRQPNPVPSVTFPLGSVDLRRAYADALERQLLSNGVSADVIVREDFMPVTLIIAGFFTKASAYQLFTQSRIMLEAKQAGFGRVQFLNNGPEGSWDFDLIGGIPFCDSTARLCR
ncbi:MAG TPA: hypothetical protein VGD13_15485 [Xanthobacteraceae bacterium]